MTEMLDLKKRERQATLHRLKELRHEAKRLS